MPPSVIGQKLRVRDAQAPDPISETLSCLCVAWLLCGQQVLVGIVCGPVEHRARAMFIYELQETLLDKMFVYGDYAGFFVLHRSGIGRYPQPVDAVPFDTRLS
jgi:hypothetical protein